MLPSCKEEGTKRCPACTGWATFYCSEEHQLRDWEVHKVYCTWAAGAPTHFTNCGGGSSLFAASSSTGGAPTAVSLGRGMQGGRPLRGSQGVLGATSPRGTATGGASPANLHPHTTPSGGGSASAGSGASDGKSAGEGKDVDGPGPGGPGGVCLCRGRTCGAHLGHYCREPAGASGRCASCRLLCTCKLIGCGVHPDDDRGAAVKCSNYAVGGGVRRCEACVEGSAGGRDAAVCACRDRWCIAHRGNCRELAGPTGRCFSCRLLCACTRGGCEVHPTLTGVRGSVMACPNFAMGGSVRRCEECKAGDRMRNNHRSCLCSCMSRGRAPCAHPARECPGIAEAGSPNCAECTKKWCAESDRTPPSPTDLFDMQDGDPRDDLNEQFRREAHDARVAEGLSEEDSANEFELSGESTPEDEDPTTEDEPPVVSLFERVHRGRLRRRDPHASGSMGAGDDGAQMKPFTVASAKLRAAAGRGGAYVKALATAVDTEERARGGQGRYYGYSSDGGEHRL